MSTLDARKNFAIAEASTGYTSGAVTVVLATGKGALYPQPSTDGAFNLVWWNSTDYPNPSDDPNKEIVRCTARSGDTLTVTRAQESTTATAKNIAGKTYKLMLTPTAKMITDIETALDGKSNVGHTHTPSQVGLSSVTNDAQVKRTEMGTANGVATLDAGGKVPTSQLPALAITSTYVVASQAAQLALTAQEGDVAVRTDQNKSYIQNGGTAGTMADWTELLTPTDSVLSVNGQTGAVTLTTSNIAEGTNLYFTDERAQDAIGAMLADGSLEYIDATPSLRINLAHTNDFTANQKVTFTSDNNTEITAFQSTFLRSIAQVDDEYGYSSMYSAIDDTSDVSGEIEDSLIQKSGFEVGMFRSGNSTVNWVDGKEIMRGYTSYMYNGMSVQGAKHDLEMIGHDLTVLASRGISNEGTHVHSIYGNKIAVTDLSTVSVDSFLTRRAYGEYIDVSITDNGDVNEAYGIYIHSVYSNQVAYAIYSETTALSHFEGDIEVPDEAYDATAWNGSLEVPTKNAIRDKIESMGGGGSSWVSVPASPVATGTAGQYSGDATYFYACVATNTWKRVVWDVTWVAGDYLLMQNGDRFVFQNGDGFKLQSSI